MAQDILMFKQQIEEDIALIQKELFYIDSNLSKDAYAFNYWVLSRIFSIDEEKCSKNALNEVAEEF